MFFTIFVPLVIAFSMAVLWVPYAMKFSEMVNKKQYWLQARDFKKYDHWEEWHHVSSLVNSKVLTIVGCCIFTSVYLNIGVYTNIRSELSDLKELGMQFKNWVISVFRNRIEMKATWS